MTPPVGVESFQLSPSTPTTARREEPPVPKSVPPVADQHQPASSLPATDVEPVVSAEPIAVPVVGELSAEVPGPGVKTVDLLETSTIEQRISPGEEISPDDETAAKPAKSLVARLFRPVLAAVVLLVVALIATGVFFGDQAKGAKAGDCLSSDKDVAKDATTRTGAKVVSCTDTKAKFLVAARIDGESDVQSKSCEKFFKENDQYYVYGSTDGNGYLLCLKPMSRA